MIDFEIKNATDLIFGLDAEEKCAQLVKEYNGTRVLIHHSGESFVLPLVQRVKDILSTGGVSSTDLGGVVPNPRIEKVREGIALCRQEKVDFILAVGGGSVIDSSKLIALGVGYGGDAWEYCVGKPVDHKPLPMGVISTFAGTGSETTSGLVINKEDEHAKRGLEHDWIKPCFAILNPKLTLTIPPFQTACGVADITSHLLENFFSPVKDSNLSHNLHVAALKTVLKYGAAVAANPADLEARSELMVLAPLAINGILKVGRYGDWACHAMEHKMSGDWDIPHGAGLAIVTPAWMRYIYKKHLDLFVSLAVEVLGLDNNAGSPAETALRGIEAMEHYFYDILKLPRQLSALGVTDVDDETLRTVVKKNFQYGNTTIGGLEPLTEEDCYAIYQACL